MMKTHILRLTLLAVFVGGSGGLLQSAGLGLLPQSSSSEGGAVAAYRALLDQYCVTCHSQEIVNGDGEVDSPLVAQLRSVGLTLDTLSLNEVGSHAVEWEKVVRKLRGGVMPPAGRLRPDPENQERFLTWLEGELDTSWASTRNPGRTATLHRLNRTEYRNAIRDLFAVEIEAVDFLPADDSSYGFDNIGGVLKMSQSLLERYLTAARTISRLAVGSPLPATTADTYQAAQDLPQHGRVEELPFGTRGGLYVEHLFPRDADYDVRIELTGTRGLRENHDLEMTIDGNPVELFTLGPQVEGQPANPYAQASTIDVRVTVTSGPGEIGVTFFKKPSALVEQVREPFPNPNVAGNSGGFAGTQPFVRSVTVTGPYDSTGVSETPSRARIFSCRPSSDLTNDAARCAREILTTLGRRAYRRPVDEAELQILLDFYRQGRRDDGSFDDGVELAIRRLLVSPEFLYRIEADAAGVSSGEPYRVSDFELASRLSFFLWSSIPDDELLDLAEDGRLGNRGELQRQVRRMIADPRSSTLTTNFASQWLQLRNLETIVRPGDPFSVAFDESLRQSMLRETELFVDSIIRNDHSMVDLLTADFTFLNERLADHYRIPGVTGPHFRRVNLSDDSARAGILGHGSVLTLTSHAIRTSPVLRGKWILNNILGTPPPDPPPNVPALNDQRTQAKRPTLRERMEQHRNDPACSSCHTMIDPTGFALENFDAIGRWRDVDVSFNEIDASGVLPDGRSFDGVAEMRARLTENPEQFVTTVTEKLMTYAFGRGLDYYDMPTLRRIVRESSENDYRMQTVILGIVMSDPFLMRRAQ